MASAPGNMECEGKEAKKRANSSECKGSEGTGGERSKRHVEGGAEVYGIPASGSIRKGGEAKEKNDLKEFLRHIKLERYFEAFTKFECESLSELMEKYTSSKDFQVLLKVVHVRKGHQVKLRRELDLLKQKGWKPKAKHPVLRRQNSAINYFQANVSKTMDFELFTSAVLSDDPREIYEFLNKNAEDINGTRYFLKEHFKIHTKQAIRELSEVDVDTLMWIKGEYEGKHLDRKQPLPYKREAKNFAPHLLWVEQTVGKCPQLWAMEEPVLVRGFLSRKDATQLLQKQSHGSFIFRLSNSKPGKLAVGYRMPGRIEHAIIDMRSYKDFIRFCWKNRKILIHVEHTDQEDVTIKRKFKMKDILDKLESKEHIELVQKSHQINKECYKEKSSKSSIEALQISAKADLDPFASVEVRKEFYNTLDECEMLEMEKKIREHDIAQGKDSLDT